MALCVGPSAEKFSLSAHRVALRTKNAGAAEGFCETRGAPCRAA